MSYTNTIGSRAWGGGVPSLGLAPTNLTARTLHVAAHPVGALPHQDATVSTLHVVAHIVPAFAPTRLTVGTLHTVANIVSAFGPTRLTAGTLHARVHVVSAVLVQRAATLHTRIHIVPVAAFVNVAGTPVPIIINPRTPVYDPYITFPANTTPLVTAVLADPTNTNPVVPLAGASVTFELAKLGGEVIYTRPATIDNTTTGQVSFQTSAGDFAEEGKTLGRFHVTYANSAHQYFPGDRYIELTAT